MKEQFNLQFIDATRNIIHNFQVEEGMPHWEVHREFITFLSAIYGYDLHEEYHQLIKSYILLGC